VARPIASRRAAAGRCVVVGGESLTTALAERLTVVRPDRGFDPCTVASWSRLLDELRPSASDPISVVLGSSGAPRAGDVDGGLRRFVLPVEAAARAMLERPGGCDRLLIVHEGERDELDPAAPFFEATAGFARSLRPLLPSVGVRSVLLSRALDRGSQTDAIAQELASADAEDLVAHVEGMRLVCTLRELELPRTEAEAGWPLPGPAGVWLITGGFGAIADRFAETLARRGGARLVLLGRSPIDARKAARIATLESLGAEVLAAAVDVSDRVALTEVLDRTRAQFGPLRGILHAAGTITRQRLGDKSRESFAATLRAKIHATVLLDELTADEPLELFVGFSTRTKLMKSWTMRMVVPWRVAWLKPDLKIWNYHQRLLNKSWWHKNRWNNVT
jgi:polyketide synthase PksN